MTPKTKTAAPTPAEAAANKAAEAAAAIVESHELRIVATAAAEATTKNGPAPTEVKSLIVAYQTAVTALKTSESNVTRERLAQIPAVKTLIAATSALWGVYKDRRATAETKADVLAAVPVFEAAKGKGDALNRVLRDVVGYSAATAGNMAALADCPTLVAMLDKGEIGASLAYIAARAGKALDSVDYRAMAAANPAQQDAQLWIDTRTAAKAARTSYRAYDAAKTAAAAAAKAAEAAEAAEAAATTDEARNEAAAAAAAANDEHAAEAAKGATHWHAVREAAAIVAASQWPDAIAQLDGPVSRLIDRETAAAAKAAEAAAVQVRAAAKAARDARDAKAAEAAAATKAARESAAAKAEADKAADEAAATAAAAKAHADKAAKAAAAAIETRAKAEAAEAAKIEAAKAAEAEAAAAAARKTAESEAAAAAAAANAARDAKAEADEADEAAKTAEAAAEAANNEAAAETAAAETAAKGFAAEAKTFEEIRGVYAKLTAEARKAELIRLTAVLSKDNRKFTDWLAYGQGLAVEVVEYN